jgi:RHS repeat-associated protein
MITFTSMTIIRGDKGNYYYGARYYDAKISVWLSVDPILKHQESPYSFTSNNPIMLIDPDGRDTTFATQQAKDRFDAAYRRTNEMVGELEKDMDKYEAKRQNGDLSDKKLEKYADKAEEYRGWKDIQEEFNSIIDENSPVVKYEINDAETEDNAGLTIPSNDGKSAWTVYLKEGYPNSEYNESVIVHENYHVNKRFQGSEQSRSEELGAFIRQRTYSPGFIKDFIIKYKGSNLLDAVIRAY